MKVAGQVRGPGTVQGRWRPASSCNDDPGQAASHVTAAMVALRTGAPLRRARRTLHSLQRP